MNFPLDRRTHDRLEPRESKSLAVIGFCGGVAAAMTFGAVAIGGGFGLGGGGLATVLGFNKPPDQPTITSQTNINDTSLWVDVDAYSDPDEVGVGAQNAAEYGITTNGDASWASQVWGDTIDRTNIETAGDYTQYINAGQTIPLTASTAYRIRVRYQDESGAWSPWSADSLFTTTGAVISATTTGTAEPSATEAQIVTGGRTVILTLTNDTWIAAGTGPIGTTANTQAIIDGCTAAQSEAQGWNAIVRDSASVPTDIARTSNTVATWTLAASATYAITANETVTCTIPAATLTTSVSAVVSAPTFQVLDGGGSGVAVFSDGFESGDLTFTEAGYEWAGGFSRSVEPDLARTGTYSLRFDVYNGGNNASAEENLTFGSNLSEVWVEYYIYYPDGTEGLGTIAYNTESGGGGNNKMLRLFGDGWGHCGKVGWSLVHNSAAGVAGYAKNMAMWESVCNLREFYQPVQTNQLNWLLDADLGQWIRIRYHALMGTGADTDDGYVALYKDISGGDSVSSANSSGMDQGPLDLWNATNYWNNMRLMGWSVPGYTALTYIWIDDVKIYSTDPGW